MDRKNIRMREAGNEEIEFADQDWNGPNQNQNKINQFDVTSQYSNRNPFRREVGVEPYIPDGYQGVSSARPRK